MSLQTWMEEFYPEPAENFENAADKGITVECIEHSIQKWKGLTPDNLDKHDMVTNSSRHDIVDDDGTEFEINGDTCSLCKGFYDNNPYHGWEEWEIEEAMENDGEIPECNPCPIYQMRGYACTNIAPSQPTGDDNEFGEWLRNKDPDPMINLLEETLVFVRS